jgi:hypothetical protein
MKRQIALLCAAATLSACTETVVIRSNPPGARAFLNGHELGLTPATTTLDYTAFSSYQLRLEKEGYLPYDGRLSTEVNIGSLIIGVVVCWPALLWVVQPSPDQSFDLTPAAGMAGAPAPTPDNGGGFGYGTGSGQPAQSYAPGDGPAKLGAFGIATVKIPLDVPAKDADDVFARVEAAAKNKGYVTTAWPDRFEVKVDADRLVYAVSGETVLLTLQVNGQGMSQSQLEKREADLRVISDHLMAPAPSP